MKNNRPRTDWKKRFWSHVEKTDGGCWLWKKYIKPNGYGAFRKYAESSTQYVHRISYEESFGKIPEGFCIDHLCRVRNCLNPAHLEVVTSKENLFRGNAPSAINKRKTSCNKGHEFSEENTYTDRVGKRHCRICRKASLAAFFARRKA